MKTKVLIAMAIALVAGAAGLWVWVTRLSDDDARRIAGVTPHEPASVQPDMSEW